MTLIITEPDSYHLVKQIQHMLLYVVLIRMHMTGLTIYWLN